MEVIKDILIIAALSGLQYIILDFPLKYVTLFNLKRFKYVVVGWIVPLILNFIFLLIFGWIKPITWVLSIFFVVFTIINYYIFEYHGSPFTIGELKNFKTAMTVIGEYSFDIPWKRFSGVFVSFLIIVVGLIRLEEPKINRLQSAICLGVLLIVMYFFYFSKKPVLPVRSIGSGWGFALDRYGYVALFIRSLQQQIHPFDKPKAYDLERTIKIAEGIKVVNDFPKGKPDIVLILNETWYDLEQIAETRADRDIFEGINKLENCIRGYTCAPHVAGGTNLSEYELLTGNSTSLIPLSTPFNVLNLKDKVSCVSFLKSQGYITLATHVSDGLTYSRNKAYPDMGFDIVKFKEDYKRLEYYGNRTRFATDSSTFKNLTEWYELIAGEDPVFMYCLTIQNHGGWESNEENEITVHAGTDFGKYTKSVNEFMSCIDLSNKAFLELTDYYKGVDRDVVVVMTGDHSPSFAGKLQNKEVTENRYIAESTPFVIWANKKGIIDESCISEDEHMSMIYLFPALLESLHMCTTPYYSYLNQMRRKVPVITESGLYYDRLGKKGYAIEKESPYFDDMNEYYNLEYINIKNEPGTRHIFLGNY